MNSNNNTNNSTSLTAATVLSMLLFVGSVCVSRAFVGVARPRQLIASSAGRVISSSSRRRENDDSGIMAELPEAVVQYSQVPKAPKTFTATTIPKGLLKQHSTKKGTWGVIRVSKGKLEYQIDNSNSERSRPTIFELDASRVGIIEPTVLHQVRPLTDDVEFVVEFHRLPGTGPVDEKRE